MVKYAEAHSINMGVAAGGRCASIWRSRLGGRCAQIGHARRQHRRACGVVFRQRLDRLGDAVEYRGHGHQADCDLPRPARRAAVGGSRHRDDAAHVDPLVDAGRSIAAWHVNVTY